MSNPHSHHPSRPACPPLQSSTASSQSSSYSSTSSLAAPTPASAPLPSPSTMHPQHQGFYGSLNAQSQQHQHRPQQPPPVQRQSSYEYQPNRNGAGQTNGETTRFLDQTSLLAEAAKRAQIAVVMRDIEGMEL